MATSILIIDIKLIPNAVFKAFENFQFVNYKICSNKGNKIEIPYSRFASSLYSSTTAYEFLGNLEKLYTFFRDNINSEKIFIEKIRDRKREIDAVVVKNMSFSIILGV